MLLEGCNVTSSETKRGAFFFLNEISVIGLRETCD